MSSNFSYVLLCKILFLEQDNYSPYDKSVGSSHQVINVFSKSSHFLFQLNLVMLLMSAGQ